MYFLYFFFLFSIYLRIMSIFNCGYNVQFASMQPSMCCKNRDPQCLLQKPTTYNPSTCIDLSISNAKWNTIRVHPINTPFFARLLFVNRDNHVTICEKRKRNFCWKTNKNQKKKKHKKSNKNAKQNQKSIFRRVRVQVLVLVPRVQPARRICTMQSSLVPYSDSYS